MKNNLITNSITLSCLFILLAVILFDDVSLWFLGMGIAVLGIILLYVINH